MPVTHKQRASVLGLQRGWERPHLHFNPVCGVDQRFRNWSCIRFTWRTAPSGLWFWGRWVREFAFR